MHTLTEFCTNMRLELSLGSLTIICFYLGKYFLFELNIFAALERLEIASQSLNGDVHDKTDYKPKVCVIVKLNLTVYRATVILNLSLEVFIEKHTWSHGYYLTLKLKTCIRNIWTHGKLTEMSK